MHIGLMASAQTAGASGLLCFAWLAAGGPVWLGPLAIALGIWAYLLPVFMIVIHRMLPFFSQGVIRGFQPRRPVWALYLMVAGSAFHGLLALPRAARVDLAGRFPGGYRRHPIDGALALDRQFCGEDSCRRSCRLRLGRHRLQSAGNQQPVAPCRAAGLGFAPVHALTIGFLSSALVGMASRVTLGHSGRPIVGDGVMWMGFWTMQAAAALRIASEFWVVAHPLAALVWLAGFARWTWHFAPAYWRPREDGEPG